MNVVIVGAGGFAREMHELLPSFLVGTKYTFQGFLGRDCGSLTASQLGGPLLGDPERYSPSQDQRFVLAIGEMEARLRIVDRLQCQGGQFLTLIHPRALVASTAELASGVIIYPFAAVSNNAKLDACVKLNYYASVGHDTQLGKCCLLAPYATVNGFSVLEDGCYMSTHSTVAPQVRMGEQAKLSANSAAMQNVPPNSIVFGVPGRAVRRVVSPSN